LNQIKIADDFWLWEFACPCCNRVIMSRKLLEQLQLLRNDLGSPILINSGYRCENYNQKIGGHPFSYHKKGMAADIYCHDRPILEVLFLARELEFTGIGYYPKRLFIHLDVRPGDRKEWKDET